MNYVECPKDFALPLTQYNKNIHSQHGEDGILEYLINKLGITKGWCCEFGAWNGSYLSNTWALLEKGWNGVLIESDPEKFKELQANVVKLCAVPGTYIYTFNSFVHYIPGKGELLDHTLHQTLIPDDFDVLSIDVDGPDYHIWKSLVMYHPKIVLIEHSGIDDHIIQREGAKHKGNPDGDGSTSFWPMKELGESKGYTLLCNTGNLIFLRKDLLKVFK